MKKMLMIYPNNFLQGAMGTNNRVTQLVSIFKEIGYEIDYFSFENFSPDSTFKDFEKQNAQGIIHELFLYDFQAGYGGEGKTDTKLHHFCERVKRRLIREKKKQFLQDWVPLGAQRMFTDILAKHDYDVIITFYTYLATLFQNREIKAKKVYFMEDSMFLQQYAWEKDTVEGVSLGKLLDEELERMQCFDEVFCISNDERIFYEKATGKDMNFLPHLMPEEIKQSEIPVEKRRWDVFFIGFNNPFNVAGLDWFLEKVYPLLDKDMKILLVGSATKNIEVKYKNVEIIPFAPDLDEIYANVKITICPMFKGTGMKVKVVEAMSKGIPVVCNERGVDGLPDKNMCGCLVTQNAEEFAAYINRLVSDSDFYNDMAKRISQYYRQVFDRKKYVKLLEDRL